MGSPPAAGAFVKKDAPPTAFRKFYERGDFPIALEHDTKGNKIAWKVCIDIVIYIYYDWKATTIIMICQYYA
jgi:hypothetical protein